MDAILAAHFTSGGLSQSSLPVRSDALRPLRSHPTRLLLQQHPVTGGRVGTVVVASYGRMRHLLISHVEVFAHNSWASALFSQPLLRPVFDLQLLDRFERHIA